MRRQDQVRTPANFAAACNNDPPFIVRTVEQMRGDILLQCAGMLLPVVAILAMNFGELFLLERGMASAAALLASNWCRW
ncbi:hypothetical protein [Bradyrhizobium cenepequi]